MIEELERFSRNELMEMDALMRELSPTSVCSEKQLRSAMEDDGIHIFIIREDGIIVATATLCVNHTPEFTVGSVEAVVVKQSCRGKGYGKSLMLRLIDEARRLGCAKLHLTSNPQRVSANALYRSLGFQLYQTNFYTMPLQSSFEDC